MAVVDTGKHGSAHDGAAQPAAAKPKGTAARKTPADQMTVLRGLLPFVWPADRPDLKMRMVWAFALLVLVKIVTVTMPILYKAATDWLIAQVPAAHRGQKLKACARTMISTDICG